MPTAFWGTRNRKHSKLVLKFTINVNQTIYVPYPFSVFNRIIIQIKPINKVSFHVIPMSF